METYEIDELIARLKICIIDNEDEDEEAVSWNYQLGVLISRKEAQYIVDKLVNER